MDTINQLRLPRLKSCCCCSLEIGAKLVALFHVVVVGALFMFIFVMLSIDQFKRYKKGYSVYYDFSHSFIRDEYVVMMVYSYIFFSAVLFYGLLKGDSVFIEPWLTMKGVEYAINIVNTGLFIYDSISWHRSIEVFILLGIMCVDAYFIIVVHSHYKQLKGNRSDDN